MYFIASSFVGMVAYTTNGKRRNRQAGSAAGDALDAIYDSRTPSRISAATSAA
jgi:hypothetical protein